jgi:ABC-type lipoprotein release transport system permease subunit
MLKYLGIASRNLLQHRRRSLFIIVAIAIVTILWVLLNGLSAGIRATMLRAATTLSSGHVNVAGFFKITEGSAAPVVTNYPEVLAIVEAETAGLDYAIPRARGWAKVVGPEGSLYAGPSGIDIARERGLKDILQLVPQKAYKEGGSDQILGDLGRLAEPGTALLFAEQARRLGVDVGEQVTLSAPTARGVNNTADVTVVAVARDIGFMSAWGLFVPHQVITDLYQMTDQATGAIYVYLKDPDRSHEVMVHLREVLAAKGYRLMEHVGQPFWMKFDTVQREDWTGQKLDLTTWKDEISFMDQILGALDALRLFLVGILMVLIMVGIMNTLWIAIRERTREIGTLRAIGMGRWGVLLLFVLEAALLGALGAGTGLLLGSGLALGMNAAHIPVTSEAFQVFTMSETLWLLVDPAWLASAFLSVTLMTGVAALYPAYRASRLRPVSAIHQVG